MTRRDALLWTSILVPPGVWFLTLLANFAIAPVTCDGSGKIAVNSVSLAGLLISGCCGLLAWSVWRGLERDTPQTAGAPVQRVRTMAVAGLVLSASFFLVILAQAIPDLMLKGCE